MTKQEMLKLLNNVPAFDKHVNAHIYVRSVLRKDGRHNAIYDKVLIGLPDWMWGYITYCIRPSEEQYYRERYPKIRRFIYQPEFEPTKTKCGAGCCGRACFTDAVTNGIELCGIFDDDIVALEASFEDVSGRGQPCSHHTKRADHTADPRLTARVLNLYVWLARYAVRNDDVFGICLRKQMFSNGADVAKTAYVVNKGAIVQQCMFWHTGRLTMEDIDDFLPAEINWNGDDIMMSAVSLSHKWSLATVQCLMYSAVLSLTSSSMRDCDEMSPVNKAFHNNDDVSLRKHGVIQFTKHMKEYPDGTVMYHSLDWKAAGLVSKNVMLEDIL